MEVEKEDDAKPKDYNTGFRMGFYGKKESFKTPHSFLMELDQEFKFDCDPCPFESEYDGLSVKWGKSNWVNPPFKKADLFVRKALSEMLNNGSKSVLLIPMRTNSNYWRECVLPYACDILPLNKITFEGFSRPFPGELSLVFFIPGVVKRRKIERKTYSYFKFPCTLCDEKTSDFYRKNPLLPDSKKSRMDKRELSDFFDLVDDHNFNKDALFKRWSEVVLAWFFKNKSEERGADFIFELVLTTWQSENQIHEEHGLVEPDNKHWDEMGKEMVVSRYFSILSKKLGISAVIDDKILRDFLDEIYEQP